MLSEEPEAMSRPYQAQKRHFENRFGGDTFERALVILESWATGADEKRKNYAAILKLHYLMGVPWDGVCDAIGLGRTNFYETRAEAVQALSKDLESRIPRSPKR